MDSIQSQKPAKKFCPDCHRAPLTEHYNFWSCPDCGGELWDGQWYAGKKDQEVKIYISDFMQPVHVIPPKKRRSGKSGRRRKRQYRPRPSKAPWLNDYF